jgi:hypothetical protein
MLQFYYVAKSFLRRFTKNRATCWSAMKVAATLAKKIRPASAAHGTPPAPSDGSGGEPPRSKRRKPGRPRKGGDEVMEPSLTLWLNKGQRTLLDEAAAHEDDRTPNWARRVLLREARKTLGFDTPPGLKADPTKPE